LKVSLVRLGNLYTRWKADPCCACSADLDQLAKVEVVYETLPGWESDISNCRTFEDLPENCQKYVRFIENYLGVKIQVCLRTFSFGNLVRF
jgi:adenylosuccinate synthase